MLLAFLHVSRISEFILNKPRKYNKNHTEKKSAFLNLFANLQDLAVSLLWA